eukprot:1165833-Prorocentrum_minimum.AAC.1
MDSRRQIRDAFSNAPLPYGFGERRVVSRGEFNPPAAKRLLIKRLLIKGLLRAYRTVLSSPAVFGPPRKFRGVKFSGGVRSY